MVEQQLVARGVADPRVLDAMRAVPRHLFVPEANRSAAYKDRALGIGHGATISQPYIVAVMTESIRPEPADRVLEIGTGSGYQAAVLSRLVQEVVTIEIVPALAERARRTLTEQGALNVTVITGDGWKGVPDRAPYDAIVVTAAPPEVPPALLEQLAPGGRMVLPVGRHFQELKLIERTPDGFREEKLFSVRFLRMKRAPAE